MTIKKICFILFVACLPYYHVFSQIDREFWFAAPAVTYSSGAGKSFFKFTSLGLSATVTLSVPSNNSIAPITVTVPANGTKFIDVTSLHSKILAGTPNAALNTGIKIVSDEAITAYYEYSITTNPEIYSLKGKNALGNQFTIVSQNFWENSQTTSPSPKNGFLLVATEDSTIIRITPSKDIVGHTAGTTFSVLLNKGQVYYAEATGGLVADHLFGSNVSSTKPIAVTTFDDFVTNPTYGTCRDLMGDQLVPDERAGTEFIAVKGFLNNPDKLFIIATQNNTRVFNNGVLVAVLQKGEIFSINVTTSNYVRTSLPSLAYHVTGTNCEVGSAVLPPLNCTGTQKVGFTRTYTGQFGIILIVRRGGEGNFTIAGSGVSKSIPSNLFSAVPGTGGNWLAANISYDTLSVIPNEGYIVTNTTSSFHLGTVDGFGGRIGGTYAYFSNFSNPPISTTTTSPVCVNTSFGITVTTPTSATYNWIRPNETKISNTFSNKLTIPFASFKDTGNYLVQAKQNGCLSPWDTVKVALYGLPVASASARKATCLNGVAQNNASIELYNGLFSDTNSLKYDFVRNSVYNGSKTYSTATLLGQSSIISNLPNPNLSTKYTIRFFTKHGCSFDTTVTVSPVNCFCNSSQLSVKEFPSDSSFSSGLGAIGSLDPNWEVSDVIYKGNFPQSISTFPSPNSRFIHYKKPIIQPTCTSVWANSALLSAPFNKANWITGVDVACTNEQEKYTYRFYRKTFVLPCNCGGNIDYPINQLNLRLNAYADNRILAIYINGENLNASYLPSSLTTFRPNNQANLVFPGPWQAGANTIEILIENGIQSSNNANLEGILVTGSQTLPSLFKIKPKAGTDFSQCYTIDSVDLADATNSQKWSVLSSPKAISLNKYSGKAKGLSKAGKYSFLLTDTATNACSDTIIVTVFDTPPPCS